MHLYQRTPITVLLLSVGTLLSAVACSDDISGEADNGPSGSGGSDATGGTAAGGTVSTSSGGTSAAGGTTVSGGSSSGGTSSGGALTGVGGAEAGTGGGDGTGGAEPGTGGATAAGGTTATGGTDAGTGGGDGTGSGGATSGGGSVMHVIMLMGQSNMAGVATRQPNDTNDDERIMVFGGCGQPAGQWNVAEMPPLNECPGEKGWNLSDSVGPGMWFAKTLLPKLPEGDTIGLVGTAESGESINTFISGGSHHNMILNKIAGAKMAEHARFAGVIFHQGESDSGQADWPGKVVQLYDEVKAAFDVDYDVPFILGEIPTAGCCGGHNVRVHEAADLLPMGDYVTQDGTAILDEYHFDHPSVVLMGQRYGEAMIEALGW